jgi:alkylation response protein AidB-like acyl-CoA dehydrogenase
MSDADRQTVDVSESAARQVAEAARETEWGGRTFVRDLFLGDLRLEMIHPYPDPEDHIGRRARAWMKELRAFLEEEVDSDRIDREGQIPPEIVDRLRGMGAFGLKIPKEYGGLGFNQIEYSRIMEILGTVDGNLIALLSAHQSIGVPNPLIHFGTEEQKKKYLPRLARGAISAFALTEQDVGSDPARLSSSVERTEDGEAYILNGEKLWATNGTVAELFVVRREGLAGRPGGPALPLHGAQRHRERQGPVHGGTDTAGEPPVRRRPGPEAGAGHAQHRTSVGPGLGGGLGKSVSPDLPGVGGISCPVGTTGR